MSSFIYDEIKDIMHGVTTEHELLEAFAKTIEMLAKKVDANTNDLDERKTEIAMNMQFLDELEQKISKLEKGEVTYDSEGI